MKKGLMVMSEGGHCKPKAVLSPKSRESLASVAVRAIKWTGYNTWELWEFVENTTIAELDPTDEKLRIVGKRIYLDTSSDKYRLECNKEICALTLIKPFGEEFVPIGDYVVKGADGEHSVCPKEYFHELFDLIEEED